jgi:dihydroxy-acid dehydratase
VTQEPDAVNGEAGYRRSSRWLRAYGLPGLLHRATLRSEGFSDLGQTNRPIVGICNSWSELVNCNLHFRALAQAVKRGVWQAGGMALEFPTISLSENLMKPTTMLYRNLMAIDVEESIRSQPFDSVVLLAGCDKTIPAQLMGAASAGVPAIMLTGGPNEPGFFRGRELGVGTDLWSYTNDYRAGKMSLEDYSALEAALIPSTGHCSEMGTASTMAILVESLGMSMPGTAAIPAVDARRYAAAELTGRRAVDLAREGVTPRKILTPEAFENALVVLCAIGGSTNAIIHLIALARRVGVPLQLARLDEISREVPMIANIRPSGEYLLEALFRAGGVPALLSRLQAFLRPEARTVSGNRLVDQAHEPTEGGERVLATVEAPFKPSEGFCVLSGSLAPDGALLKRSVASEDLLQHRGRAVVFDKIQDLSQRLDDPHLDIDRNSILILRNSGPRGAPGMPEWGMLPIPTRLLAKGVTDILRISDARMSGTAFGTVVLHVAPEAAAGGPLALVHNGDYIILDVASRKLDLDIGPEELATRRSAWQPAPNRFRRGYRALYVDRVLQANEGCDFDFLQGGSEDASEDNVPSGLFEGWVGGW